MHDADSTNKNIDTDLNVHKKLVKNSWGELQEVTSNSRWETEESVIYSTQSSKLSISLKCACTLAAHFLMILSCRMRSTGLHSHTNHRHTTLVTGTQMFCTHNPFSSH